ncbi:transglutaminase-like domain-containing protein [Chloroflexi bacterium]|nr:transglutaminase-like domain-containing protein [Chloroflexota bacterium]
MNKNISFYEMLRLRIKPLSQKVHPINDLKKLLPEQGITLYFILLLSFICTINIVKTGNWVPTPGIYTGVIISSLIPVFLNRTKMNPILIHILSLGIGTLFVLYQTLTLIENMPLSEKFAELKLRLEYWYGIATNDGISTDLIPYTIILLGLSWILGHTCSWFTFRYNNAWISILFNGVSILTCLSVLPEQYSSRFYIYAFTAMILITHITTVKQRSDWIRNGTSFSKLDGWLTLNSAVWYSIAILVISTAIPLKIYVSRPVADTWKSARAPVAQIEDQFARLLGSVPSRTHQNGRFFGKFLPFIGSISFKEQGILTTKSDYPNYWVSRTYDTYTHEGWISGETTIIEVPKYSNFDNSKGLKSTKSVNQLIEMSFPSNQFFSGGNVSNVSEAIELESLKPKHFKLVIGDANSDSALPLDLQEFEARIEKTIGESPSNIDQDSYQNFLLQNLPEEYKYIRTSAGENDTKTIDLVRSNPPNLDIVNWNLSRQIPANKKLAMTSNVSVSTPEDLRDASQIYHGFIKDHYLGLPEDIPLRIASLAKMITFGKTNVYDKAVAIEGYLRSGFYQYSQKISTPPVGVDGVDYFLFTSKTGYSDYFASAMTVMLRSMEIPARLATGYSSGSYDIEKNTSTIKDSDSHGWVQVYFPDYGWIDFEPTPNWEIPSRSLREKTPSSFIRSDSVYKDGDYPKRPENIYDDLGPEGESVTTSAASIDIMRQKTFLIPVSLFSSSLVLFLLMTVFWKYGLSGLSPTERITTKMYRLARLAGISKNNYQTMDEYALLLSSRYPTIKTDIYKITNTNMMEKYSAQSSYLIDLETPWTTIRSHILKDFIKRIFQWTQKNDNIKSN